METYPLKSMTVNEAVQLQFKIVDEITKHFNGIEILTRGDLGVSLGINKPLVTKRVEQVISKSFDAAGAVLVRGAGTAAIRDALHSVVSCGEVILVHEAPIYKTTQNSINMLGIQTICANFNNLKHVKKVLRDNTQIKAVLIQYTRQTLLDSYDISDVIQAIKSIVDIPIITDDNYAALKVKKIGIQCGADLSCFSTFKLQGPEGVGCIVGKSKYIDDVTSKMYSGGSQVQGFEALEVLRGLSTAPVLLAVQAEVLERVKVRLNNKEVKGVKKAFIANAQSKVLLVELCQPIAKAVLKKAVELGGAQYPIGAESKYEIAPLFYRVSGTFIDADASLSDRMIRVNPMRAGDDTVIRILKEAIEGVDNVSK